jgi:hypothetical protein
MSPWFSLLQGGKAMKVALVLVAFYNALGVPVNVAPPQKLGEFASVQACLDATRTVKFQASGQFAPGQKPIEPYAGSLFMCVQSE